MPIESIGNPAKVLQKKAVYLYKIFTPVYPGFRRLCRKSPGTFVPGLGSLSKKSGRGGALTRPRILLKQNPSPQGENYGYFPSENPKNFLFRRAGRCPAPTVLIQTEVF